VGRLGGSRVGRLRLSHAPGCARPAGGLQLCGSLRP